MDKSDLLQYLGDTQPFRKPPNMVVIQQDAYILEQVHNRAQGSHFVVTAPPLEESAWSTVSFTMGRTRNPIESRGRVVAAAGFTVAFETVTGGLHAAPESGLCKALQDAILSESVVRKITLKTRHAGRQFEMPRRHCKALTPFYQLVGSAGWVNDWVVGDPLSFDKVMIEWLVETLTPLIETGLEAYNFYNETQGAPKIRNFLL
ncbi:hypothetical protein FB45DRAFT_378747 [Roridomyces roridus]|uniref:Uncharacterized protein n=1 Tax=Roridomyces roridus TaxID=1738132 RepID=A0AAD7FB99_9AGAR|nr:hypothetical protein FB45DRAFT_378747 [Roridomyces roridus]